MQNLEIDLLRAFVAVADNGGFTNAARHLHRTQSAVSMKVKRLEEIIGKQVFDRSGRTVALTGEGEVLLGHARHMLRLNEEAMAELVLPEVEGVVRLAIPDGYGTYFLPRILSGFVQAHPRVQLQISCGSSGNALDDLDQGRADIALVVREPDRPPREILWVEPIEWVDCDKSAVHEKDPVPLALLQQGCVLRARALKALDAGERKWFVAHSSGSLAAMQAAVVAGLAVGVLGQSAILPGMRVLGPEKGFPSLHPAEIELRKAPFDLSPACVRLTEYVAREVRAFGTVHSSSNWFLSR